MDYDDVDVSIIDSRDSFGVLETNTPKNTSNDLSHSDRFFKKPFVEKTQGKRESNIAFDSKPMQTKFSRKTKNDVEQSESDRFTEKRNESKKTIEPLPTDYKYKQAITFQDKLSVLEDRDRYLREAALRNNAKNMNTIAEGTCPDMCPEKERLLREINCSFSIFEGQIVQNEMHVVPELLVKEYARSSADQEEPLSHELRPEPVLIHTMSHLLANIIPKIEESTVDVGEWYHFCWDRLRSLRKDIIQQQLCSRKIVELLEQSARFHICCFDLLSDCERRIFDDKINAENLVNCLQMLITMYEDLEACGHRCENECEFRIYMMLLLLDSGDLPTIPKYHNDDTRQRVEQAREIYFTFKLNLYTKFFKLVRNTHYLNACILQRYFTAVRVRTLNTLVNAYSSGSQMAKFPLPFMKKMLELDNDDDTVSFVSNYGFTKSFETNEIHGSKSSFCVPETKLTCKSSYIIEKKRVPILEAVTQVRNYRTDRQPIKVHSSFNENDKLKKEAWNAGDQRAKVIELYGDIYEMMEHSKSYLHTETNESYEVETDTAASLGQCFNFNDSVDVEKNTLIRADDTDGVQPPPTDVFNFGAILPSQTKADVDTYCRSKELQSLTPPPKSPKISPMRSNTKCGVFFTPVSLKSIPDSPVFLADSFSAVDTPKEEPPIFSPKPAVVRETTIAVTRKPDEIMNSLTDALNQFEQVYWDHFGISESDRIALQQLKTLKENRKLRRVVKNRLKRISAQKAARIWKRKVENSRKKEENFVGITHLPPQEYFRLWGTIRKHDTSSIVKEMLESRSTTRWSHHLLNAKACRLKYIGFKLANHLISTLRCHYNRISFVEGQLPSVICCKLILTVSGSGNLVCRSFVNKLNEFCRALYYKDMKSELGSVQVISTNFKQVLTSVQVRTGTVESEYLIGLSHLTIFVNELWENLVQFSERTVDTCDGLSHPVHVSLMIIGECSYKTNIFDIMSDLQREKIISGWSITKWKNFLTVPSVIFKACQHLPVFPSYRVENLESFIETVGNEFFTNLYYIWGNRSKNSPIGFIDLYNKFLMKLRETIEEEHMEKYNLSPEFLPRIVDCEGAQNNLTNEEIPSLVSKYVLISFTKWPPNSVEKMIKLLKKYCDQIEKETSGTLLPNVLRLLNMDGNASVEDISSRAPWLKIVELWFRYNLCRVSKNEDAKKKFIFYEKEKVINVAKGLWIGAFLDERDL